MGAALNEYDRLATKAGTGRTEVSYTKADMWLIAQRPDLAAQEAHRALSTDPQHLPSLLLLSSVALTSGQKEQIEKVKGYVATMKEVAADDIRVVMAEVNALDALGDLPGAVRAIRIAMAKNPKFPPGYPTLVSLLDRQNDLAGALEVVKEWRTTFPTDPNLLVESIRLNLKAGKPADAKSVADQYVADRVAEAKKAADEIRVEGPNAAALAKRKDELVKTTEAQALGFTATGFSRGKDHAEAERRLRKILTLVPDSDTAHLMLGDLYIAQAAWDKAIPEYRKVLDRMPQHYIAGNNLAWVLAMHKNDPAGALKVVEDVRKGKGAAPVAVNRLPVSFLDTIGVVYGRVNKPEKFLEMKDIFETAIKRYPLDPRMYMYLGEAQAALGDKSRAAGNFDSALRLASPDIRNGLSDSDRATVVQTVGALKKKYQ
jgi:tetratricopeptide (TPR) repeat protein